MVTTQQIPRAHWAEYLRDLAEQCRGWNATVEVMMPEIGDQTAIDRLPLLGLVIEPAGTRRGDILIETGTADGRQVLHYVVEPAVLQAASIEPGARMDVLIESVDGMITLLRLHPPSALPAATGGADVGGRMGELKGAVGEREGVAGVAETGGVWGVGGKISGDEPLGLRPRVAGAAAEVPARADERPRAALEGWERAREPAPVFAGTIWWPYVLRGVAAVVFGGLAIAMPGMALLTLVLVFGLYAIADGVLGLIDALRPGPRAVGQRPRWVAIVLAMVSFAAGAVALSLPGVTAMALLIVIGAWAIAAGVLEIVASVQLRALSGSWVLGVAGALAVVFGILVLMFPGAGALALVLWIGAWAVVFGIALIGHGLWVRQQRKALAAVAA